MPRLLVLLVLAGCAGPRAGRPLATVDGRDGHRYGVVWIGRAGWLAEAVRGAPDGRRVFCPGGRTACPDGGALFTFDAARTACPPGTRLPDAADWDRLADALGGASPASGAPSPAGRRLAVGGGAGFDAQPDGFRSACGAFALAGRHALFWSTARAPAGDSAAARFGGHVGRHLYPLADTAYAFEPTRTFATAALSVRCVVRG